MTAGALPAGPPPAWFLEAQAIAEAWGPFESELEVIQLRILCRGGVVREDFNAALRALDYRRGPVTGTEWGYVRAVMLNRAADRVLDESAARRRAAAEKVEP